MEISQETRDTLRRLAEWAVRVFSEIRKRLLEWIQENWQGLKAAVVKWYQLEEERKLVIRKHYKRDFSRPRIAHQVIDRKPQYMVKKIIR